MDRLFYLFERSVLKDGCAYSLTDLHVDIKDTSKEYELDEPPLSKTCTLEAKLREI